MKKLISGSVILLAVSGSAQWTVVNLHPDGATESGAYGVSGEHQAGYARVGGSDHASRWSGSAASWVDLHPASAAESFVYGMDGDLQVGWARVAGSEHASLWKGSAASWVDLHPSWATSSVAFGIGDGRQAGMVTAENRDHAGLWSGIAGSWLELHPAGARESRARAVRGSKQVGSTFTNNLDTVASLWSNTSGSWKNLHPAVAWWSEAYGVDGNEQSGYAMIQGDQHASLWRGTAESWVDLNPVGARGSFARATHAGQQVGKVWFSGGPTVASLWNGTAESWVNLHVFVPSIFSSSEANSISHDGEFVYVVGSGHVSSINRQEALMWISREVAPTSFSVLRGSVYTGDLSSLQNRDDNRLVLRPGPVLSTSQPPVQIVFDATAPTASPNGFSFSVESSASFGNAQQGIALWNYTTGAYDLLDTRLVKVTDDVAYVTVQTNPSRFIQPGTLAIRALVTYRALGPSLSFPWSSRIDKVWWNFPG